MNGRRVKESEVESRLRELKNKMENLEVWVKDKMERIGLNSDSNRDSEERENEEVRNSRSGSTINRRRGNSEWGSEVSEDRLSIGK